MFDSNKIYQGEGSPLDEEIQRIFKVIGHAPGHKEGDLYVYSYDELCHYVLQDNEYHFDYIADLNVDASKMSVKKIKTRCGWEEHVSLTPSYSKKSVMDWLKSENQI